MDNTFREGSKSHSIMESINKGDTYDKIVDTMKLKGKHDIYVTVSKNRKNIKMRNLQKKADPTIKKEKAETGEENTASEKERNKKISGEPAELSELDAFKKDILKSVTEIVRGTSQGGVAEEKIEVDEGSLIKRVVYLTPKSLVFFDTARAAGYPGNLSAYLNDTINKLYEKKGVGLGLTQLRIL